ncbi:MAG: HEAT repeat domain-containing protein [Candidatus Omnitrophica bacterium]|nr:HEAT repeat domain-containing protein [Candidatus Omnitrophota bacterium]
MKRNLFMTNHGFIRRLTSFVLVIVFGMTSFLMPAKASAQSVGISGVSLPAVGTMMGLSESFQPPIIRGMSIYPGNPLRFDFIVNTGDENISGTALEQESQKLIKYFLASLTTPENEFWVNLSPYESGRIIPEALGVTEMGRDMLAQDYILKQLTASLIYPEQELGSEFWQRVREKAQKLYGVDQLPVNTFNKVWIMPDKAAVYENDNRVFVVERHLKVMLEEDYAALSQSNVIASPEGARQSFEKITLSPAGPRLKGTPFSRNDINKIGANILRELIIPEIEKEVNEGRNFAAVRQIYNSMILATWYKKRLKESLLGQVYVNQNKTKGIDLLDKETKQKIYEQYLAAFKKGVYNYIKEDTDALTNEPIPRKYFSGGLSVGVATVAGLKEYQGSLSDQPANVRGVVAGSPLENGRDVVVSSSLIENARPGDVTVASPSSVPLNIKPASVTDTKNYMLSGAASSGWSVSAGGVVEQVQSFGYAATTWAQQAAEFATHNPGTMFLIGVALYAVAEFDPIGYFTNKVEFNLRRASALEDNNIKRYLYLDRIVMRGQDVIPELLAKFEQEDSSSQTVRDIAYVFGKLKAQRTLLPIINKLEQENVITASVLQVIALALERIDGLRARAIALTKLESAKNRNDFNKSIIFAELLGKLGEESSNEFLSERLSDQDARVRNLTAQSLAKLGNSRGVELVIESLQHERGTFLLHARSILSQLRIMDRRVLLFDRVYNKLQAELPMDAGDVVFSFPSEFAEAYQIVLRGGDFRVRYYSQRYEDPIDFGGWDNGDHPLAPQYNKIIPPKLDITEIRIANNFYVASSAIMGTYKAKAVIYFGRKGFKGTIPSLLKLLGHPNLQFRFDAGEILVELGVTKEQMVDAYIAALGSDNISGVIQKLGELGDARAIESLLPLLSGSNYVDVETSLIKLNATKDQMVDGYMMVLGSYYAIGLKNAIQKLGELGDVRAIEPLLPLLSGSNYTDVETALEKLNVAKDKMINQYRRVATSSNDLAQANALLKLGEYGDIEFLVGLLQSDKINGHGKVSVRHILNQLNVTDPRVLLYDRAYQELQSQVRQGAGDVGIKYPHQLNQVYHILLRGGEFRVDYYTTSFERNLTSEEIAQLEKYDIFDHPLTIPDTTTEHVEELIITEVTKSDGGDVASAAVTAPTPVGGIDFNSAGLDLQIKRDDKGVALPLPQQTIQNMKIDGFYPVIINIAPIQVPLLFGMQIEKEPQKLSAL